MAPFLSKNLTPIVPEYQYQYPLKIFSKEDVSYLENTLSIESELKKRNPYFILFEPSQREQLIRRINSLMIILNYIRACIKEFVPSREIVSVYSYGSYLYGHEDYKPDDIDIGVVIKGGIFKYILNEVKLPPFLLERLPVSVNYINFFFYGEDNMVYGKPIDDTVKAGIIHRHAIKREISVAYWRNVVIYGRDFLLIRNNLRNAYISMMQALSSCYERLSRYGHHYEKESDEKCLIRVANRLYEINVFLILFNKESIIDKEYVFRLPSRALQQEVSYEEIEKFYEQTIVNYNNLKCKFFPK